MSLSLSPSSSLTPGSVGSSRPHPQRIISDLVCGNTRRRAFNDPRGTLFSLNSRVDILEVDDAGTTLRRGLDDSQVKECLRADKQRQGGTRLKFFIINGIEKQNERLHVTSDLLSQIFETYNISSRYADFLSRQHSPGRAIYHEANGKDIASHEMWYSAVIRPHKNHQSTNFDLKNGLVAWQRFCAWSNFSVNGDSTFLMWSVPQYIQEIFYTTFIGENAIQLRYHPMLAHSFFVEHMVVHAYDFLEFFSDPLYSWEERADDLHTASDYTERSQAFLSLARNIHQVDTDYSILKEAVDHVQQQNIWFKDNIVDPQVDTPFLEQMSRVQGILDDEFVTLLKDVSLVGVYSRLYLERSKIGVDECFAMVNQRDAEINIKMAAESTMIARTSQNDNRSLRIIQIMSMIFLPASFVSGIFGMGFFTTSLNANGKTLFSVSAKLWLYPVVAVPLTLAIIAVIGMYRAKEKTAAVAMGADLENQIKDGKHD